MAYASEFGAASAAHKAGLTGLVAGLKNRFARFRLIRATYNELNALSGRELADLGLHRSQITRIAIEAANERFGA